MGIFIILREIFFKQETFYIGVDNRRCFSMLHHDWNACIDDNDSLIQLSKRSRDHDLLDLYTYYRCSKV